MSNKSYRIKTDIGTNKNLSLHLDQDYNVFEILSLKLGQTDTYRLHNANYGVIVGRVLANNGFGVENARLSIFIEANKGNLSDDDFSNLYEYNSTSDKNEDGIRYNLLPDEKINDCHQVVGTFPSKTYLLANDGLLEVFDNYYKYTVKTNHAGDYILCGVPVGSHTLHMDLDLSDCGILSQRPRDFVYKGYTIEQFKNPNQFKTDTEIDTLSQIFSQDTTVNVIPFWGTKNEGDEIGISRADVKVNFKFEPTCVFMGCIVGDNASNGISKRCKPTENMGAMDELVTGEGTIEMIRKTPGGKVEEFQVKGTELINGDGVWCYQVPMNLDYVTHDEYGNIVPTNDPSKGIPTRTRARFRVSMNDFDENTDNYFRAKVLIPHNPKYATKEERSASKTNGDTEKYEDVLDYNFGSATDENSFRDLYWNNVYTVKGFIPRFQKSQRPQDSYFTGIKHCNIYGQNNPIPYNNIRIKIPLMFRILCALIKTYVRIVTFANMAFHVLAVGVCQIADILGETMWPCKAKKLVIWIQNLNYTVLSDGLCPDLENWYFAPGAQYKEITVDKNYMDKSGCKDDGKIIPEHVSNVVNLFKQTFDSILDGADEFTTDNTSIDATNNDSTSNVVCLTNKVDYLISCIELNLAEEYKVINFDFYNDWINGMIYMPRWMRYLKKKRTYAFGLIQFKGAIKYCNSADSEDFFENRNGKLEQYNIGFFERSNKYTQQCCIGYDITDGQVPTISSSMNKGCGSGSFKSQSCHKKRGMGQVNIFGPRNGGAVHAQRTLQNQYVYYFKPCEWDTQKRRVNLFATDLVLLGSLNDCDSRGVPQAFKYLSSSSFKMPTNLALTNMEESGYLYGSSDGTMCSGQHLYVTSGGTTGVTLAQNTFASQQKFFSGSEDAFTYSEADEYVPMTEAAGIAWNYTGPDQGKENYEDNFYQPGGHFLGMSCIKAETNLKSCINLERICEMGTTMSQRHEIVNGYTPGTSSKSPRVSYKYIVPTGLIGKDDVIGSDFRAMFATMNQNKLLARTYDTKTGYLVYNFDYSMPYGFSGQFNEYVKNPEYNKKLVEGIDFYVEDTLSGVTPDKEEAKDLKNNTYRRTLEEKNGDYYMFRMGLKDLKRASQITKYLGSQNGFILPQYQNSFYFYFGLKSGATALDELNKQFFSVCETEANEEV